MDRMSNLSDEKIKALKAAFPGTIPVMTGYIFLGMAFGILLNAKGYGIFWALLMSIFIYAGSMQYVAISLLASAFNPIAAFYDINGQCKASVLWFIHAG